jgi:prepilin peptidase CpaA
MIFTQLLLFFIVAYAVFLDLRTRKIPNALTINALWLGLLAQMLLGAMHTGSWSWVGLLQGGCSALLGIAVALALGLFPFAVGGVGAGDVKLVMAMGAFVGPVTIFWAILFGTASGGLLALLWLALSRWGQKSDGGRWMARCRELWNHAVYQTVLTENDALKVKFPYSFALFVGLMIAWLR